MQVARQGSEEQLAMAPVKALAVKAQMVPGQQTERMERWGEEPHQSPSQEA